MPEPTLRFHVKHEGVRSDASARSPHLAADTRPGSLTLGFPDGRMATSPFKFLQEVREETRKVTWPSRKETMITAAMVFVMVAIASVFFLVADQVMRIGVSFVLGLGS